MILNLLWIQHGQKNRACVMMQNRRGVAMAYGRFYEQLCETKKTIKP